MPPHRLRHFLRRTREPRIHGTRLPSSGIAMASTGPDYSSLAARFERSQQTRSHLGGQMVKGA
jgi:hypothetical protein